MAQERLIKHYELKNNTYESYKEQKKEIIQEIKRVNRSNYELMKLEFEEEMENVKLSEVEEKDSGESDNDDLNIFTKKKK